MCPVRTWHKKSSSFPFAENVSCTHMTQKVILFSIFAENVSCTHMTQKSPLSHLGCCVGGRCVGGRQGSAADGLCHVVWDQADC